MTTRVRTGWMPIPHLVGELAGRGENRFLLLSGHVDAWHYGAMDNGTANATMLEVARLLAARRDALRRGIRFAFWSGHSHGRYAGSAWYADHAWRDLHQRCVAHLNVDSTGARGATDYSVLHATEDAASFAAAVPHFDLAPALDAARTLVERLERLPALLAGIDAASPRLETINRGLMRLSRVLVPLAYTSGDRFTHDLALPLPPLAGLQRARELTALDPDTDAFKFARAALVRERNRAVHAFDTAASAADDLLHQ